MNARVFLLLVVTGLFMTVWNGDQTAMDSALARRTQRQAVQLALRDAASRDEVRPVVQEYSLTSTPIAASVSRRDVVVPRPARIAAGIYQAVNQAGATSRFTVSAAEATSHVERDFYTVDAQDGNRWYLIRIVTSD